MPGPSYHARTHRPPKYGDTAGGGTDPIRGMLWLPPGAETDGQVLTRDSAADYGIAWADAAGLTYVATPNKHTLFGPEIQAFNDETGVAQGTFLSGDYVFDASAPFGGYLDETTDGSWFTFAMPLGPRYSLWAVNVWWYRDTDGGIIELEWATTSIDQLATDTYGSIRSIANPPGDVGASWFYPSSTAAHYQIDTYGAAGWQFVRRSRILITGADGAMLSADGTTASDVVGVYEGMLSNQKAMNGGGDPSVMWWLRLKCNGKNASSSGYRMRVAGISVVRIHADGNSVT